MVRNYDGFAEQNGGWKGTPEELAEWQQYKPSKALVFVQQGYCVAWSPDGSEWMDIYLPERPFVRAPELRAEVELLSQPGMLGIDQSRVDALTIYERRLRKVVRSAGNPFELMRADDIHVLYNSRRPEIDLLSKSSNARVLYDAVLAELR